MYAKSTRPSAKRDDQIPRPKRAQACERIFFQFICIEQDFERFFGLVWKQILERF